MQKKVTLNRMGYLNQICITDNSILCIAKKSKSSELSSSKGKKPSSSGSGTEKMKVEYIIYYVIHILNSKNSNILCNRT